MPADDLTATFLTAQAAFTERVHAVAPDQWQLGTPDAEWTVADLVGHLVDEHRWAAPLLAGLDMDAARAVVAGLGPAGGDGAALVRAWDRAAATSAEAFRADGALTGQVAITRGSVPAVEYLEEMVLDLIVHAWDLGVATGYLVSLPACAAAAIYRWPRPSSTGRLPACSTRWSMSVPAAPVIDRLVALTGRRPRPP